MRKELRDMFDVPFLFCLIFGTLHLTNSLCLMLSFIKAALLVQRKT